VSVIDEIVQGHVRAEILLAHARWGPQTDMPDGTGGGLRAVQAAFYRRQCEAADGVGKATWRHVLEEEHAEALAEVEPGALYDELIQVAAVAMRWAAALRLRDNEVTLEPVGERG